MYLKQNDKELGNEDDGDQSDRVGGCVGRGNVVCFGDADQGAERGGAGNRAGDGAEVAEHIEFQHVFCKQVADDHRRQSHDDTVDKVAESKEIYKSCAACDARTDKEKNESQFFEDT